MDDVETPAILVDRTILERNIAAAADRAARGGVALRPHVKSHKSVAIAVMQMAAGARGITVAKSSEAVPFIEAGIPDVTVAHPLVDRRKIRRLFQGATRFGTRLTLIVDSATGLAAIAAEAAEQGFPVNVQIKVDVGLHRCGVDPSSEDALDLARAIAGSPPLRFGGLLSHAGHAYAAAGPEAVREVAAEERRILLAVAKRLGQAGIAVPEISIGSTPTVWLDDGFEGIAEIRPGNYVFMDLTQASLGFVTWDDIALSVLATVVSCNDTYAIIDAGSKVLSSDRGPHGSTRLNGYGLALTPDAPDREPMPVVSVSEEHGFVAHGGRRPAIGDRLRILPNHACTVVNLARELVIVENGVVQDRWPVDAHLCVM